MTFIINYTGGGPKDGHVATMTDEDSYRLGIPFGTPPSATNFPSKLSGYHVYDQCSVKTDPIDGTMHVTMRYVGRTCYRITVNVKVFHGLDSDEILHVPAQLTVHRDRFPDQSQEDGETYYLSQIRLPGGNIAEFSHIDSYLKRGKVVRLTDDDGCDWQVELPSKFAEIVEPRDGVGSPQRRVGNAQADDEI